MNSKPADSVDILERIQSKIEEKMTRADTNAAASNHQILGGKSTTSIRRCPNLQRMIEKKKQEDMDASVDMVRQGGSILKGGIVDVNATTN